MVKVKRVSCCDGHQGCRAKINVYLAQVIHLSEMDETQDATRCCGHSAVQIATFVLRVTCHSYMISAVFLALQVPQWLILAAAEALHMGDCIDTG